MAETLKNLKRIEVIKGEEFKEKITSLDSKEFFYEVYEKAINRLGDIVDYARRLDKLKPESFENQNFNNNIIAFCGDRGQGKSSAMLTFSKMLGECSSDGSFSLDEKSIDKGSLKTMSNMLKDRNIDRSFYILKPIDPTQLEDKDDILKVIVSRIFDDFKKYWQNGEKTKGNIELKSNILDLFQRCYKHIITIKNSEKAKYEDISFEDTLEELARLGDSSNLKKDLFQLIQKFFEIRFNEQEYKKYMLVIQIDDTDLNVNKAYEMVEDLRKYLMVPNVVIIMATKIEQLTKAVEQEMRKKFATLIEANRVNHYEMQQMASKYIDKLIPDGRKIHLPEIRVIPDTSQIPVLIEYKEKNGTPIISTDLIYGEDIQDQIFKYLYSKTGIFLIKPDVGMHCFLPRTIRELVNLLALLSKMEDIKDIKLGGNEVNRDKMKTETGTIDIKNRLDNLEMFEEYLLNTWIPNYVDDTYIHFIQNLSRTTNDLKHKRIITDMFDVIENFEVYSLDKPCFENKQDRSNFLRLTQQKKENLSKTDILQYSIRDVMEVLEELKKTYQNESIILFSFSIKMYYTITLNRIFLMAIINGNNDALKEFIGDDIFRGDISRDYYSSFKVEIDSYLKKLTPHNVDKETCLNKISDFVFWGYKDSNFDYLAYKEEKSNNDKGFSAMWFGISIPILKYIYESTLNQNTFVFFFLNLEVNDALQNYLKKYQMMKESTTKQNSLSLFYENIDKFIFGSKKNISDSEKIDRFKPKFIPFEYTDRGQIVKWRKLISDNKDYIDNLLSFAPVLDEVASLKNLQRTLRMTRTYLDKEITIESAIKRVDSFLSKTNISKDKFEYDQISLEYITNHRDDFLINENLNEGENLRRKINLLNNMDTFIGSIVLKDFDGEE